GDRIDVKLLRFESGEGSVAVSGQLQAPFGPRASETRIVLDRFAVPLGPGQAVVLSGSTVASLRDGALSVNGRLVAEEGTISLDRDGEGGPARALRLADGRGGAGVDTDPKPAAPVEDARPAARIDDAVIDATAMPQ